MNPRVPAHVPEAERDVVGTLLLRPDRLIDVADTGLSIDDFYAPKWANAYAAILRLVEAGEAVDTRTVEQALQRQSGPRPDGADLVRAMDDVPNPANVAIYAAMVHDAARVRAVLAAAAEVVEAAYDPGAIGNVGRFCDWAEERVFAATSRQTGRDAPGTLVEALDAALCELEAKSTGELVGVSTGLSGLDAVTGGLRPGQLAVVGARPGVGKSAFVFGVARHVAETVGAAYLASAEMGRVELGTRALAGGGVPSDRLLAGRLDETDWQRLRKRRDDLAPLPLFIDDSPGITLAAIRAKARRLASGFGLSLVVVDYVQLVGAEKQERRELEVAEVSRGLKSLARELSVPVIAVSQLNRAVELRKDKEPVLADLRDSGQIEQDADLVLLLHRPFLYDFTADALAAELKIAKHRNGPTGTVRLQWLSHRMTFLNAPGAEAF